MIRIRDWNSRQMLSLKSVLLVLLSPRLFGVGSLASDFSVLHHVGRWLPPHLTSHANVLGQGCDELGLDAPSRQASCG